uniref:Uncharacterized protein n=1 Tax=Fagus sylvatica TaxID=28930 RepID=A0A2N9J2F6_FAGSY
MLPPPSPHANFFSSLKQVEKRLKLEDSSKPPTLSPQTTTTESLSSPIYLHLDQSNSHTSLQHTTESDQQPPQAFLSSSSLQFPQTQQPISLLDTENQEAVDDIQRLIQLLGLSDCNNCDNKEEEDGEGQRVGDCCDCEGGFYAKIVGVKGPKCGKEVERLEGWIDYFMNGEEEEKREPLRLAYLLLGKSAFADTDGGFGGLEFPTSVDQFLHNDPPKD